MQSVKPSQDAQLLVSFDTLLAEWRDLQYGPLSVILVGLRYLSHVHQTQHWISKQDNFYGDHLLFDRLYNDVAAEIDRVGEKAVGLGIEQNVDFVLQARQFNKLVKGHQTFVFNNNTLPRANATALSSMAGEVLFEKLLVAMVERLEQSQSLTRGLDNLLAEIADKHEEHRYLLKRRLT